MPDTKKSADVKNVKKGGAEMHPLKPFFPEGARLLMLGTFPPKVDRWCMDFFYPNFQNDMWRIFGHIFFDDAKHFVRESEKSFDKTKIVKFLESKKIALYDTAVRVCRKKDNASDAFLEVEKTVDLADVLKKLPDCSAIAATGKKASEILSQICAVRELEAGGVERVKFAGREFNLYRMVSSSRAYPLSLQKKAEYYADMFGREGLL